MVILLRDIENKKDRTLTMAWRNIEVIRQGFYSQDDFLTWEEHSDWLDSRNKDFRIFIIVLQEGTQFRDIGECRAAQLDNWNPEVNIYIGEVTLWGKGYGGEVLFLLMGWLKEKGYSQCHTTIKDNNRRAIRLFKGMGFKPVCVARQGETRYERML